MSLTIQQLAGLEIGHIVSVSDIQTMVSEGRSSVDMKVTDKKDLSAAFSSSAGLRYLLYTLDIPDDEIDLTYLMVVKIVDDVFDIFLYYHVEEGDEEEEIGEVLLELDETGEDLRLVDEFNFFVHQGDDEIEVIFAQRDTEYALCAYGQEGKYVGIREYAFVEDYEGCENPLALIVWEGTWLDMYMGTSLEEHELEVYL